MHVVGGKGNFSPPSSGDSSQRGELAPPGMQMPSLSLWNAVARILYEKPPRPNLATHTLLYILRTERRSRAGNGVTRQPRPPQRPYVNVSLLHGLCDPAVPSNNTVWQIALRKPVPSHLTLLPCPKGEGTWSPFSTSPSWEIFPYQNGYLVDLLHQRHSHFCLCFGSHSRRDWICQTWSLFRPVTKPDESERQRENGS